MDTDRQTCPLCKGQGYKLVKHPAILHLCVIGRESCDICGGSGFMSIGYCWDCEKRGPWNLLKDSCIYCRGRNTINIDSIPKYMLSFPRYWKIIHPYENVVRWINKIKRVERSVGKLAYMTEDRDKISKTKHHSAAPLISLKPIG